MDGERDDKRIGGVRVKDKPVVYVFVGDGLGVPGLPHEVTQEQAEADGVGTQLAACIAAGMYVEKVEK